MFFPLPRTAPVNDTELAQLAERIGRPFNGVSAAGLAQRVASAVIGRPADFDERSIAALVPDADRGLGENGFSWMLTAAGCLDGPACLPSADLIAALRPAGVVIPQDRRGNLVFDEAFFAVSVSDAERAVFGPDGTFGGVLPAHRLDDRIARWGRRPATVRIPVEPAATAPFTPLYRRKLAEIVLVNARPSPALTDTLSVIINHPGFGSESALREYCHVHEFPCSAAGMRLFRVVDRHDRRGDAAAVPLTHLWLMKQHGDGRLEIVGGRRSGAIHIRNDYRGRGLGAELCLTAHDDPALRDGGTPYNRTIGSHKAWQAAHRLAVRRALAQGLEVPETVMADYPYLGEPAPAA